MPEPSPAEFTRGVPVAEANETTSDVIGEGRVVIRDIAVPKSVTLPPWFTDPAGSDERARRLEASRKPRPV